MPPQGDRRSDAARIRKASSRGRPERLGDVLPQVMARVGFHRVRGQEELEKAWKEAVGEAMASMTRPTGIASGTLQVQVDHNLIAQELNFREKELLERLRRDFPQEELQTIRYRVVGR